MKRVPDPLYDGFGCVTAMTVIVVAAALNGLLLAATVWVIVRVLQYMGVL